MKKNLTLTLMFLASLAQAQYFHHWYNRSLLPANASNETFYDGIRTKSNFSGGNPLSWFNVGYGATFISPVGALVTDQARFVRTPKTGASVAVNTGTSFADNNTTLFFNTYGHAICEINNGLGTGGYLAVGNVASNFTTSAQVPGGSDGLFYKMTNAGVASARYRFDANGGAEYFTDIIASSFSPGTYYVCGYAHYSTYEDAVVMSIQANGTVNWFKTYQFDPTWPASAITPSAYCRATGIAEDVTTGNLMVVGYLNDQVPAPAYFNAGLVFVLNSAGVVVCAQAHNSNNFDNQYHDVIQKSNGNFAICGFTGDLNSTSPSSHIWLTEMNITCGLIASNIYDHVLAVGSISMSKGYAIKERQNTGGSYEYYIAGPDIVTTTGGGTVVSVSKISAMAGNAPVAWYDYQAQQTTVTDDAYGIDYANAVNTKPGILVFSNTVSPPATTPFNDCLMLKTYFNGADCINRCTNNLLIQAPFTPAIVALPDSIRTTYKRKGMIAQVTNYTYGVVCSQTSIACGSNARDEHDDGANFVAEVDVVLYPNPATDFINVMVNVSHEGNYTIAISDVTGRLTNQIKQYFVEGEQVLPVDLTGLSKGMYSLIIRRNDQQVTKKFVRE